MCAFLIGSQSLSAAGVDEALDAVVNVESVVRRRQSALLPSGKSLCNLLHALFHTKSLLFPLTLRLHTSLFFSTVAQRIVESGFDMKKAAIAAIPVAAIATPAFAMDSIIESLPTQTLALEVQFGAYLAVLLGTLLPVLFLINLYVQTESRKAGRDGGQDAE